MLLQMALFHSFLWLSSILIYHIFFIHSSVDGHLGCFYVLVIVISAAMNIEVSCLLELEFLSFPDICPQVELLDYMITLFSVFKGTSKLFSIMAAPMCIPTNRLEGSPFQVK